METPTISADALCPLHKNCQAQNSGQENPTVPSSAVLSVDRVLDGSSVSGLVLDECALKEKRKLSSQDRARDDRKMEKGAWTHISLFLSFGLPLLVDSLDSFDRHTPLQIWLLLHLFDRNLLFDLVLLVLLFLDTTEIIHQSSERSSSRM